jgi:hypothetical protein
VEVGSRTLLASMMYELYKNFIQKTVYRVDLLYIVRVQIKVI